MTNSDIDHHAIIKALDRDDVATFADIKGSAPDLAVALHHRYGSMIYVIGLDRTGRFKRPSSTKLALYLKHLADNGVDAAAIKIVAKAGDCVPFDVIASLDGFGSRFRIASLKAFLKRSLHDQSRVIVDIRKGQGAYPFLNTYGACNTLQRPTDTVPGRVVLSVEPRSTSATVWSDIADELVGADGFFTDCEKHSFLYIPRGDTLVVTFDNLDIAMTKRDDRRPWGFKFIQENGWSMLGVMANGWTWFRDPSVDQEFVRLRESGFFEQFRRVVFYGASMGGYGAAAFSAVVPGSTVFAISPQSTLDKSLVPWETRYKVVWDQDFSGPFGDAAIATQTAENVHLLFDPYVPLDAAHAARFKGSNVRFWRCPLLGHRLGSSLMQMGVLQEIAAAAIDGTLTRHQFYGLLRARHQSHRYQRELANLALERGRADLADRVCRYVLKNRKDNYFSNMQDRLRAQLATEP